jgi:hypothetical protein
MATWEGRRNQEHTVNTSQQVGVYLIEKRYRGYGGEQGKGSRIIMKPPYYLRQLLATTVWPLG